MCDIETPSVLTQTSENSNADLQSNTMKFLYANKDLLFRHLCPIIWTRVQQHSHQFLEGICCQSIQQTLSKIVNNFYTDLKTIDNYIKNAEQMQKERDSWINTFEEFRNYAHNQTTFYQENILKIQLDCNQQIQNLWRTNSKLFFTIQELNQQLKSNQKNVQNRFYKLFKSCLLKINQQMSVTSFNISKCQEKIQTFQKNIKKLKNTIDTQKKKYDELLKKYKALQQSNKHIVNENIYALQIYQQIKQKEYQNRQQIIIQNNTRQQQLDEIKQELHIAKSLFNAQNIRSQRYKKQNANLSQQYSLLRINYNDISLKLQQLTQKIIQIQIQRDKDRTQQTSQNKSIMEQISIQGGSEQISNKNQVIIRTFAHTEVDDELFSYSQVRPQRIQQQTITDQYQYVQNSVVSKYLLEFMNLNVPQDHQILALDTLCEILQMNQTHKLCLDKWKKKYRYRNQHKQVPISQKIFQFLND